LAYLKSARKLINICGKATSNEYKGIKAGKRKGDRKEKRNE
jgi:hypothetical protein